MLLVGLTGGIGSGKSTFAALLAERGAQVIDVDAYARDALRPGEPAWHSVLAQFGNGVLVPQTMEIDRQALADIVFADSDKLAALNAIVHPILFGAIADSVDRLSGTSEVVILDAAIIVETGLDKTLDALIVVHCDDSTRVRRLKERGMSSPDITARMRAQLPPEDLIERADILVDNSSDLGALAAEADRVWPLLRSHARD